MKIIYTLLLVMFFLPIVMSQEIKIIALDNPDEALNGQTIEIAGSIDDNLVYKEFRVINESNQPIDFYYQRRRLVNSGAVDQICDDLLCHDVPDQDNFTTGVPNTTNPGDSALFKPQMIPAGEDRCAIHDYYVVSQFGTIYDSIRVQFVIGDANCSLSTVEENIEEFQLCPNPASNYFVVDLGNNQHAEIVIKDALGKTILQKDVDGKEQVSTDQFNKGLYFVNFIAKNGKLLTTQKLIVR